MPEKIRVRWADPQGAHLTLAFLGEVGPEKAPGVADAMREAALGFEPFRVRFGGLGAFRSWRCPRVIWLGLMEGGPELVRLQSALLRRLDARGFVLEKRDFKPHLTLGRLKSGRLKTGPAHGSRISPPGLDRAAAERLASAAAQVRVSAELAVAECVLFQSNPAPSGAVHSVLARQSLLALSAKADTAPATPAPPPC